LGRQVSRGFAGKRPCVASLNKYYSGLETVPVSARASSPQAIAIYHTHTAESYLPTDGRASIPFKGGIYHVGDTFKESLKKNKVVAVVDKTPHDPHDKNAYTRSRRTAFKLLKEKPAAMFDIHRDGVYNPNYYLEEIDGRRISQMRLIVGRQNPNMSANLDFAKRIMAYTNKQYPGLVKDIYAARGNYNQDLLPTALLIEAGTYTNRRETAEQGIALFANTVPAVLNLPAPAMEKSPQPVERAPWKTTVFIIMLVLVGGAVFAAINAGPEQMDKLTRKITGKIPVDRLIAKTVPTVEKALLRCKVMITQLFKASAVALADARRQTSLTVKKVRKYLAGRKVG